MQLFRLLLKLLRRFVHCRLQSLSLCPNLFNCLLRRFHRIIRKSASDLPGRLLHGRLLCFQPSCCLTAPGELLLLLLQLQGQIRNHLLLQVGTAFFPFLKLQNLRFAFRKACLQHKLPLRRLLPQCFPPNRFVLSGLCFQCLPGALQGSFLTDNGLFFLLQLPCRILLLLLSLRDFLLQSYPSLVQLLLSLNFQL